MRRAVFLSAIVLAGLARGVAAQQAPGRSAQRLIDSVTTSVTASAAPRTIQVFVVPVPVSFRPDRAVDYTVVPTGGATIIPPLHGIVAAGGGEARSVMVATSVPAGALAGPRTVAAVEFSQGGTTVPVALEIQVSRTRSGSVRLAQQLYGAQPREQVTIPYVVTNTGNAPDTFDVSVVAPSQWTHAGAPRSVALGVGETTGGEVTVMVPRAGVAGVFQVGVVVAGSGRQLASAEAVLQLLDTPSGTMAFGPKIDVGVASVLDDSGKASPVIGIELAGPVTDQIQAFGRIVQATNPHAVDQRGLARVGYYVGGSFLTLAGREWQATGGNAGRSFSDVTGTSAYGRGASVAWTNAPWSVASLAAVPISVAVPGAGDGHLVGMRVSRDVWRPGASVNATMTDLQDPQLTQRRLQAVGIGAVSPAYSGMTASGELAQRWFAGGAGLGWITDLRRQTSRDFGQLRFVHAPGGSAAFANAKDALTATGSRMLSRRLAVSAGVWTSDDDNVTFSRLHTQGLSFSPRYDLTPHTSLQLEARSNSFTANSAAGLLGNGERSIRVGVSTQRGTGFLSGAATLGSAFQTAGVPGSPTIETSARRQALSVAAGTATDRGTIELSASFDHSGAGIGLQPYAYVLGVRAQGIALGSSPRSPMVNAEFQYYSWFGDRPAMPVARVGMVAPLPSNLMLTLDIERNPFISGLGNAVHIIPVLKLTRTTRLPLGTLRPAAKGEVFEDLNGNGARDRGEPGMAGAVVRHGAEMAVTDRTGRFRFYDRSNVPVRLDETSLPIGMIADAAATAGPQQAGAITIGVIRTAQVDVQLVPTADSSGRLPNVDLNGVPLQALDSAGNAWAARTDAGGLAHFYALPPGRYRVQVDVSGLRERLRLGPMPAFTVESHRAVPLLRVLLYPRPIRMFDPSGAGPRGSDGSGNRSPS